MLVSEGPVERNEHGWFQSIITLSNVFVLSSSDRQIHLSINYLLYSEGLADFGIKLIAGESLSGLETTKDFREGA